MSATVIPGSKVVVEAEDLTVGLVCFDYAFKILGDRKAAGKLKGYVEATFGANPGLAAKGLILPRGTVIDLPEFVVISLVEQADRLWDDAE